MAKNNRLLMFFFSRKEEFSLFEEKTKIFIPKYFMYVIKLHIFKIWISNY